jgi:hypothetical protein
MTDDQQDALEKVVRNKTAKQTGKKERLVDLSPWPILLREAIGQRARFSSTPATGRGMPETIAPEDLMGDGKTLPSDHQPDDHLLTIGAMIARIAAFGLGVLQPSRFQNWKPTWTGPAGRGWVMAMESVWTAMRLAGPGSGRLARLPQEGIRR